MNDDYQRTASLWFCLTKSYGNGPSMSEKKNPQKKNNKHGDREQKAREIVGSIGTTLVWVFVDLTFVWPESHERAYWLGFIIIVFQLIQITQIPLRMTGATIGTLSVVAAVGYQFLSPTPLPETPIHGWLLPAVAPGPNRCGPSVPKDALMCLMGTTVFWSGLEKVTLLQACGHDLLTLKRKEGKLWIDADIFEGKILAQIKDNEFFINPNNAFRIERPNVHELTIYDQMAEARLSVIFVDANTVRISGKLEYPNCTTFEMSDKGFTQGTKTFGNDCFGGWSPIIFGVK